MVRLNVVFCHEVNARIKYIKNMYLFLMAWRFKDTTDYDTQCIELM